MQRAVYKAIESRKRNENAFVRLLWILSLTLFYLWLHGWIPMKFEIVNRVFSYPCSFSDSGSLPFSEK